MVTNQGELTNPAQELFDTCDFLNHLVSRDDTVFTFLERRLDCQNNLPLFFTILAALSRRFDTLDECIQKSTRITPAMREDAVRKLEKIRTVISPSSLNQRWESIRSNVFTDTNRTALLYLGSSLQLDFPLRKLSPSDRQYLIRHLRRTLETMNNIAQESVFGAIAANSLRSVLMILERLECFGVDALVEATVTSCARMAAVDREVARRGERPKIRRLISHGLKILLIVHGAATFVNDGVDTYEELWGRSRLAISWITDEIAGPRLALPPPQQAITYQPTKKTIPRDDPTEGNQSNYRQAEEFNEYGDRE